MMRIVALICELAAPEVCIEIAHDFVPRQPVACIFAAGPELAQVIPEGWRLVRFECRPGPVAAGPDAPAGG